jgi:DNA-binding PadR family transcriptional regulator
LTPADLVVLSLLTERPMHGYELNQELERREVEDWAGVSRPQVYYSLKKLAERGYITPVDPAGNDPSLGPERSIFTSSPAGRRALAGALARPGWAVQRPPPPFLTWLALSTHAGKPVVRQQVRRRRGFLEKELAKERATLKAIKADKGEMVRVAALMVTLTLRQFESELAWLKEVEHELAL